MAFGPTTPYWPLYPEDCTFLRLIRWKSVMLKGVSPGDAVYRPIVGSTHESMAMQMGGGGKIEEDLTPIALARVGKGSIGYIGDVNAEEATTKVVLAMMGLGED
ncbi:hypothetical protein P7C70_g7289, partial [Phenoliferia sp. Uapishka_3]